MELNIIGYSANSTPIYTHPDAHPHRLDLAAEAIAKMVIPEQPADPTDRTQTRVAATIDLGRKIGVNHLVETDEHDTIVMFDRGRGYPSRMVLKETEPETRITSVCFWDTENSVWVLWTNFEGEEGLPEPGCDRYNRASESFKRECDEFWAHHALVPTKEELRQIPIKTLEVARAVNKMFVDMDALILERLELDDYEYQVFRSGFRSWC